MDVILSKAGPNPDVGSLLDLLIPDSSRLKHSDFDDLLRDIDSELEARTNELQQLIRKLVAENGSAAWPDDSLRELHALIAREQQVCVPEIEPVQSLLEALNEIELEKENLETSISFLETLDIYRTDLQKLRNCVSHKDYDQTTDSIERLLALDERLRGQTQNGHLQATCGISKGVIQELQESFKSTCEELQHRAQDDFRALDDCDPSSAEFSRSLCRIIALVSPLGGYGPLMHEFFESRLRQYDVQFQVRYASSLKVDRKSAASQQMKTFSKRKLWLKPDEIPAERFPPEWLAGDFFLQQIASLTRNHLSQLLDVVHDELSYEELCALMRDVKMLELTFTETGRILRQKANCLDQEITSFDESLTKLFDGFTQPWLSHMREIFKSTMSVALTSKDSVEGASAVDGLICVSSQPRLIFKSALRLVEQLSDMIEDCRIYSVTQINQDCTKLLECFLSSYLEKLQQEISKWNFPKSERKELADCTRVLSADFNSDAVFKVDDFGSQTSLESSSGGAKSSGDFAQLVCLNSTLEWLWMWITRQWRTSSSDDALVKRVMTDEVWKLRNTAYESALSHFRATTINRHPDMMMRSTEVVDLWRQWCQEIDRHCSLALSGVFKDATAIMFARTLESKDQVGDLIVRALEWLGEEQSVVGCDELKAIATRSNILY